MPRWKKLGECDPCLEKSAINEMDRVAKFVAVFAARPNDPLALLGEARSSSKDGYMHRMEHMSVLRRERRQIS